MEPPVTRTLVHLLWVGAGGFFGAISRYALGGAVHRLLPGAAFPYGTLAVNVVGCLLIGLAAGLSESRQVLGPEARLFLVLGFLGSFTTFSTFGYETLTLARDAEALAAAANVALHLAAGLGAAWLGLSLGLALGSGLSRMG
jgi:CrcB protein